MTELKPCPFCGDPHAVTTRINTSHTVRFHVRCRQCSCIINRRFVTEEEAIEAWNRRGVNDMRLIEQLRWWAAECDRTNFGCQARKLLIEAADALEYCPTIDADPVVRCKDCKHWKPSGSEAGSCFENLEPIGGCRWVNFCRKASDFCSYGERKDGEG